MFGPDTTAYRLINGAGDDLPGLVVDRYNDVAVVRIYSTAWVPYLDHLAATIASLPWVGSVFRRFGVARVDGQTGGETLLGPEVADTLVVLEHGMRLLCRPYEGQKTGLFLDQRTHRHMIRGWASGRLVANLFSYNGGFSVAAALGGAATVCTVDVAPQAIEDARENFRLNQLDPSHYDFVVADVFDWEHRSKLDLLIIDPPSMAKSHKAEDAAKRAYSKLHKRFGPLVSRGGLLATASCTARLSRSAWEDAVAQGLRSAGRWTSHWKSHEPLDHPVCIAHRGRPS